MRKRLCSEQSVRALSISRRSRVLISSANSGGMIAPIVGGILLGINNSVPVYVSAVTFFLAAVCALALPFESAADVTGSTSAGGSGEYSLLH